jgi:dTDP-4-amino-4,6-dideoxygalactose transaminase
LVTQLKNMNNKIWLSSPHMGGNEQRYVNEAFETNWIAPLGPNVDNFEKELGGYLGINHVAALSSGTAAIHLALIIGGVTNGDEVLCQSFTFSATVNPIVYQGAKPILIDSEKETWNMDPELLEKAIIERISLGKKPKACIVVHLYGMPAKIVAIKSICEKYEILLIEDAAEALGSKVGNQKVGTFGQFGVFSFNGNKIITTSGGGALVSNNEEHIKKARFLATQARDDAPHYQHSEIGYNYRMSNISAGIGRGQLKVLDEWIEKRRKNFELYHKSLNGDFLSEPTNTFSNRWLSTLLFNSYEDREHIRQKLLKQNIESRPLWKPMHLQPIFKEYPNYSQNISESLFEKGLCLPSGSNLKKHEIESVINTINEVSI